MAPMRWQDAIASSIDQSSTTMCSGSHHSRATLRGHHAPMPQSIRGLSDKAQATTETEPAVQEETVETSREEEEETKTSSSDEPEPSKEEELENKVKELRDQLLRSLAEQDNTRRIAKRDVEMARQMAIKNFAKSLLDVSDNLARALESVPKEELDTNSVLNTLYQGIEMTEKGLMKAFESNGLVQFGQVGEPFDPTKHSALLEYPDPEKKPGTIGQVIKTGYLLNKHVLRAAEVAVVKKTE